MAIRVYHKSPEVLQTSQEFRGWGYSHPERRDNAMLNQWPIARIIEAHQGRDGLVRVVKLRTKNGIYTRPVTKVALLLPCAVADLGGGSKVSTEPPFKLSPK